MEMEAQHRRKYLGKPILQLRFFWQYLIDFSNYIFNVLKVLFTFLGGIQNIHLPRQQNLVIRMGKVVVFLL